MDDNVHVYIYSPGRGWFYCPKCDSQGQVGYPATIYSNASTYYTVSFRVSQLLIIRSAQNNGPS